MKYYWLYLESYVFVFKTNEKVLFYNSLSGHHFVVNSEMPLKEIISKILKPSEMYCIKLNSQHLEICQIRDFIALLRENYMGEIMEKDHVKDKPISLYPKVSVMKSRKFLSSDNNLGYKVMTYLNELTIQVTGKCKNDCTFCNKINKQISSCTSSLYSDVISIEQIENMFKSVLSSSITRVIFKGGNLFLYNDFDRLIHFLKFYPNYIFKFIFNYKHFECCNDHYISLLRDLSKAVNIEITIQFIGQIDFKELDEFNLFISNSGLQTQYEFVVLNSIQYTDISTYCESMNDIEYEIVPYITLDSEFFNDILIDDHSLFSQISTKRDIFRRQTLNTNDFGTLQIVSNGDVYANINMPKLGNINKDKLSELVCKEFVKGKSWFRIRNQSPCRNCVYQWLCPSPSNYELTLDKQNLCTIYSTI